MWRPVSAKQKIRSHLYISYTAASPSSIHGRVAAHHNTHIMITHSVTARVYSYVHVPAMSSSFWCHSPQNSHWPSELKSHRVREHTLSPVTWRTKMTKMKHFLPDTHTAHSHSPTHTTALFPDSVSFHHTLFTHIHPTKSHTQPNHPHTLTDNFHKSKLYGNVHSSMWMSRKWCLWFCGGKLGKCRVHLGMCGPAVSWFMVDA